MKHKPTTRIPGLSQMAIQMTWEWRGQTVVTREPIRGSHTQWRVEMQLKGDASFLAALIIETPGFIRYGRIPASCADKNLELIIAFLPMAWHSSSKVQVSFGQRAKHWSASRRVELDAESVKLAPPEHSTLMVPTAGSVESGSQQPIMEIDQRVTMSCVLVHRNDVIVAHDRWRLPESQLLERDLGWLATGRRSGDLDLRSIH
jgi:hypothetical protein